MAWRIGSRVAWQVIAGEVVIVDLVDGKALGLNPTGSFVWTRLTSSSEEEIAAALAAEFTVELPQARNDVAELLADLEQRKLVERT
jgi:hypothetical protein